MPSPFIVLIVVGLDPGDEASRAMTRTVQDALADTAVVVVREEAQPEDTGLLTRLGERVHANAVVSVHWSDEGHAQLRVYRTAASTWTSRDVAFGADDPPSERGRSLGYGIAAIVRAAEEPVPPAETPRVAPVTPPPPPAPPAPLPRWDVELAGQAVIGGAATSGGASLGAGLRVVDRFAVRAAFAGRAGSIDAAAASSTFFRATAGGTWPVAFHRFTVGPRFEIGAIRQQASRSNTTSSDGRWSAVLDLRVEGTVSIVTRLAVVVGLGAEVALERVSVRVDALEVTALPPVRALGSVGVRLALD